MATKKPTKPPMGALMPMKGKPDKGALLIVIGVGKPVKPVKAKKK